MPPWGHQPNMMRFTVYLAVCTVYLSSGCDGASKEFWRRSEASTNPTGPTASVQDDATNRAATHALKPLQSLHGRYSKIVQPKLLRITTDDEWRSLWAEHTGGEAEPAAGINPDFRQEMVIAIFEGSGSLCSGFDVDSIAETSDCITIRVHRFGFQVTLSTSADSSAWTSQAWGIFILPRSDKKIVLEQDKNPHFNRPPQWVKWKTLPAISSPDRP